MDNNIGTGKVSPVDAEEFIEVTVFVEGDFIEKAQYTCSGTPEIEDCAKTVCAVITDKPFRDIMQMNANAVIYNTENDLPRLKLYCAAMAVTAAKKAVADFAKKNDIEIDFDGVCSCFK